MGSKSTVGSSISGSRPDRAPSPTERGWDSPIQEQASEPAELATGSNGGPETSEARATRLGHSFSEMGGDGQASPPVVTRKAPIGRERGGHPALPGRSVPVQRYLELNIKDTDVLEGRNALEAYKIIGDGLTNKKVAEQWTAEDDAPAILGILNEWISAPKADMKNVEKDKVALSRAYSSYEDVATAVLRRVSAAPKIAIEEILAKEVMVSKVVLKTLCGFITDSLKPWLDNLKKKFQDLDEDEKMQRLYLPYLEKGSKSVSEILGDPEKGGGIGNLVSAIHDLAEVLYHQDEKELKKLVTVPEDKMLGLTYNTEEKTYSRKPLGKYRGKLATPEEQNPVLATASHLKVPVSLGPSRTTGKLMMLAEQAKASPEVKHAIAMALFAFWYTEYRRDLTDIHRYHFVMDMAANFEVPYDAEKTPLLPKGIDYESVTKTALEETKKRSEETVKAHPVLLKLLKKETEEKSKKSEPEVVKPVVKKKKAPKMNDNAKKILRHLQLQKEGFQAIKDTGDPESCGKPFDLSKQQWKKAYTKSLLKHKLVTLDGDGLRLTEEGKSVEL